MTDLVTFGETMLRLSPPQGDRLATAEAFDAGVGGAESNVAVAAANLGADAVWLSRLPDSQLGHRVVRELRSNGVRTGVSWADGDERLGTYYLEFGGAPRGTEVVYDRAGSAFTDVSPDDVPLNVVHDTEYVHVTGITPALSPGAAETAAAVLRAGSAADATTAFDLNYRAKLWDPDTARAACEDLFPHVDVLFVAIRDAREVLGEEGDAIDVAHSLRTANDFETVVITRGEHGAVAVHDDEVHEQDGYEADTLDAIGSGDAFVGGYLTARTEGEPVSEALDWGAATAALKRTVAGDLALVSRAEIERVIAEETADLER